MKISFKGFNFELDHATTLAILSGGALYIKALLIDYWLSKNKNISANNIVELGVNLIKKDKV